MLDLKKDIFSHLAISADRFRNVNMTAKRHSDFQQHLISDEKSIETNIEKETPKINAKKTSKIISRKPKEAIEEKVSRMTDNPELKSLKEDIENAEIILRQLKKKGTNKEMLLKLETKISELKKLIDDKSYV